MRLPRLVAAAALTVGLVAGAPAAQAAPVAPTHAQVAHAQVVQAAAVRTTLTATVQKKVKSGHDIQVKATLKHETSGGLKPSGHQKLELRYFTDGEQYTVATGKTDLKGKVTFRLETVREMRGHSFRFRVVYPGTAKAKASTSGFVKVKVAR